MRKSKHGEEEQGYLAERLVFVHGTKIINIPKNTCVNQRLFPYTRTERYLHNTTNQLNPSVH